MKVDIIFVTYNSKKWIKKCFESVASSVYDLKNVGIYVFDNNSNDGTIEELKQTQRKMGKKFKRFDVIESKKNYGFGIGNNRAFKKTDAEYIFFLNIDCEIEKDTLAKIDSFWKNASKEDGILELRQMPYEHPKYYDPYSHETSWASGACFVIRREVFEKVGGFDKNIFMYAEDVDLSWKVRKNGYKIKYDPSNPIWHYSYNDEKKFKKVQYINSIANNVYLRMKYGTLGDMLKNILFYRQAILIKNLIGTVDKKEARKIQWATFKKTSLMFFKGLLPLSKRIFYCFKPKTDFKAKFVSGDYEVNREGAFYQKKEFSDKALVSIIVRTYNRPTVLKETLISILNQTYQNFEIIVVEDGKSAAQEIIRNLNDPRIKYFPLNQKKGRCYTGNFGLSKAKGKYINFLDDDDLFYCDHIETLVSSFEKEDNIIYSSAFATELEILNLNPYQYEVKNILTPCKNKNATILDLLFSNQFPIQSVMFRREVYEQCGGFDEKIDVLEDWDLWIRFGLKFKFKYIDKTTSLYRIPFDKKIATERIQYLDAACSAVREKHLDDKLIFSVNEFYQYNSNVSTCPQRVTLKRKIKILIKKILIFLKLY